jgi:hypothetical protein
MDGNKAKNRREPKRKTNLTTFRRLTPIECEQNQKKQSKRNGVERGPDSDKKREAEEKNLK